MLHLTLTGYHAGQTLCGAERVLENAHAHAMWAPLGNPEYRQKVCPECLKVWEDVTESEGGEE